MNFPILKPGYSDFVDEVKYEVIATRDDRNDKKFTIIHTLYGQSYITQLLQSGEAQFSVLLLFKNSSERQYFASEPTGIKYENNKIVVEQIIEIKFSYAPEITPYIVILNDAVIASTDKNSGLSKFWQHGNNINIPEHSRIALHPKITFTSGGLTALFKRELRKDYKDGVMEVSVSEHTSEKEVPVTLVCGRDVYDFLGKYDTSEPNTIPEPTTPNELLFFAIITNALSALYAYMQTVHETNNKYEERGVLFSHLNDLKEKTKTSWEDEGQVFNPSLAATRMLPYMLDLKILNDEHEDE